MYKPKMVGFIAITKVHYGTYFYSHSFPLCSPSIDPIGINNSFFRRKQDDLYGTQMDHVSYRKYYNVNAIMTLPKYCMNQCKLIYKNNYAVWGNLCVRMGPVPDRVMCVWAILVRVVLHVRPGMYVQNIHSSRPSYTDIDVYTRTCDTSAPKPPSGSTDHTVLGTAVWIQDLWLHSYLY